MRANAAWAASSSVEAASKKSPMSGTAAEAPGAAPSDAATIASEAAARSVMPVRPDGCADRFAPLVPFDLGNRVAELSLEVSLVHHELKLLRRRVGLLERGSVQDVAEVGESVLRRGADGGQRLERGAPHVDLRVVAHDEDQRGH